MKINKTVTGVVITILVMWAAWIAAEKANAGVYAELGHTALNSSLTTHAIGYRFDSFGVAVEMTGQGETSRGEQRQRYIASAYYVTDPSWRVLGGDFKTILGYAYTPSQKLIGDSNFMLEFAIGYRGGVEFYLRHRSSAGAWRPNTGVDSFGMRKLFLINKITKMLWLNTVRPHRLRLMGAVRHEYLQNKSNIRRKRRVPWLGRRDNGWIIWQL